MDCLFCKIIGRKIPAQFVHEDEHAVAIQDINPQAPVHLLVIPRKHLVALSDAAAQDQMLLGHLLRIGAELARERGLEAQGFRTVINNGAGAGQTVFHLHVHVLGGRPFHWPPG